MRIYLSSYLWGNRPEKILELLGDGLKHAALITNSADNYPEEGIVERLNQDIEYLATLGITSERLDLRNYFDNQEKLIKDVNKFGLIWVRGANVFVLRRAFRQSGFDSILTDLLKSDRIVYGGYSAGACVVGSTLRGLDLVDDANLVPQGYDTEPIWEGLNILPYAIAPHYQSDHPESADIDKAISYYIDNHVPFVALKDGQAMIINGDSKSFIE